MRTSGLDFRGEQCSVACCRLFVRSMISDCSWKDVSSLPYVRFCLATGSFLSSFLANQMLAVIVKQIPALSQSPHTYASIQAGVSCPPLIPRRVAFSFHSPRYRGSLMNFGSSMSHGRMGLISFSDSIIYSRNREVNWMKHSTHVEAPTLNRAIASSEENSV